MKINNEFAYDCLETGLGYSIQHGYGRNINTDDIEFNEKWAQAYDLLMWLEKELSPIAYGEVEEEIEN
jgi:hypothetical protein